MKTFKEFFTSFGLVDYPFASFTTENEGQRFEDTFIHPDDYETILENYNSLNSMIITGDRGTGKTALLMDFISKIDTENDILVHITDFSQLDKDYNLNQFYKFLLNNFLVSVFQSLAKKPSKIRKLSNEERILLSYLLKNYIPTISKRLLKEQIEQIQISSFRRGIIKLFNKLRGVLNYGATVGITLLDEAIAKHFKGLPTLSDNLKIKNIFPELPLSADEDFINQNSSYQFFKRVVNLARKMQFKRLLFIFDKADEDARFANDAEDVGKFILPILTDNSLLLDNDIQIIFSNWITPFNYIKDQVRTQKHYCPTLTWSQNDLARALDKRLEVYSNKNISDYQSLFSESAKGQIQSIFSICNNNPRDLWHIMNYVFRAQYELDQESNVITPEAISKALTDFVTLFNYYEYYPRRSNARANTMDIYSYAKHLLKLEGKIFTKNQLKERAQTGSSNNNYIVGMEKIGLIAMDSQVAGVVNYKIKDPKIVFALENGLEIRRD